MVGWLRAGDPHRPGLADRGRERRRATAPCRGGGQRHRHADAARAAARAIEPLRAADVAARPVPRLPGAHWVEPRIVIRAEFAEWTTDGLLRQAAFKGIELEQGPARRCVREERAVARPRSGVAGRPPACRRARSRDRQAASAASDVSRRRQRTSRRPPDELDRARCHEREQAHLAGRRPRGARHQPGQGAVPAPTATSRAHQARPDPLLRDRRADAGAVPARTAALNLQRWPDGDRPARASGRRTCPATRRLGRALDYHQASEGVEGLRRGRQRRRRSPGSPRRRPSSSIPWTSPTDCAGRPDLRADRHRSRATTTTWRRCSCSRGCSGPRWSTSGVIGLPKVTGKRGIQVWMPIEPRYTLRRDARLGRGLSRAVGATVPELVSWEWAKRDARRPGAPRLHPERDQQDARGAVLGAAVRRGAGLGADHLGRARRSRSLRPDRWTIRTLPARLAEVGDLFAPRPDAGAGASAAVGRHGKSRGLGGVPGSHRSGAARGDVRTLKATTA